MINTTCRECGSGTVRPIAAEGRTQRYRGIVLPIPTDLEIPTCDNCGSEWINRDLAKQIDQALEQHYQKQLRARFDYAIAKLRAHNIPLAMLERAMRLSQGYLSKLRSPSADKNLSASLVSHLLLLAKDPARVRESQEDWEASYSETA